jgi:hypothetical protein
MRVGYERFFQMFWIAYIGIMALLAITIALETALAVARHQWSATVMAIVLYGLTVALCVLAEESRQAIASKRQR